MTHRTPSSAGIPTLIDECSFSITLARSGMTATVHLAGEFDMAGRREFDEVVRRLEAGDPARIVVNLSRLSFMDCAGLRALRDLDLRCRQDGRILCVVPGPWRVQRLFELTGTTHDLTFTTLAGRLRDAPMRRFHPQDRVTRRRFRVPRE